MRKAKSLAKSQFGGSTGPGFCQGLEGLPNFSPVPHINDALQKVYDCWMAGIDCEINVLTDVNVGVYTPRRGLVFPLGLFVQSTSVGSDGECLVDGRVRLYGRVLSCSEAGNTCAVSRRLNAEVMKSP